MASVVDICNSALNLLGASTISSITEDTKNARLCNQRFAPIRDRVFRSHNWNCLIKRVQLAQDSTAPVVEYSYAYTLPTDCLRVLKIHNGSTDSIKSALDYKIEGRKVVTDETTIYLVYIALITDPNEFDSYLREAISHQLAADICYAITNNSTLANNYMYDSWNYCRCCRLCFVISSERSNFSVKVMSKSVAMFNRLLI